MFPVLNVVILTARCTQVKQLYAMRVEEKAPFEWEADWAFPVTESIAAAEKFGNRTIQGAFTTGEGFPGCPYCRARGFWLCGTCGKVGCWDTRTMRVTCPWCSKPGELGAQIEKLNVGADR